MLDGYKTYIIAACMVAYAILGVILGKIDGNTVVATILEALAIAGLRKGVDSTK